MHAKAASVERGTRTSDARRTRAAKHRSSDHVSNSRSILDERRSGHESEKRRRTRRAADRACRTRPSVDGRVREESRLVKHGRASIFLGAPRLARSSEGRERRLNRVEHARHEGRVAVHRPWRAGSRVRPPASSSSRLTRPLEIWNTSRPRPSSTRSLASIDAENRADLPPISPATRFAVWNKPATRLSCRWRATTDARPCCARSFPARV